MTRHKLVESVDVILCIGAVLCNEDVEAALSRTSVGYRTPRAEAGVRVRLIENRRSGRQSGVFDAGGVGHAPQSEFR